MTMMAPSAFAQERVDLQVDEALRTLRRVEEDLANLERGLALFRGGVVTAVAQARFFPIERRMTDADLLFETHDFDKAATLYRDLVDNPAFATHPGYQQTVFKLAESLFALRNYVSAARYYRMAAVPQAGPRRYTALARLFETAVRLQDFQGLQEFESMAAAPSEGTPEVWYAYGRFLYHRGDRMRALTQFGRIPAEAPGYARARYFMGVIQTASHRLDAALATFTMAAGVTPSSDVDREIQGLAVLARARVLHELERYQEAIAVLQEVPGKTQAYLDSLFDTAWTFVKLGELEKATHALNMLLMVVADGRLAMKASALRGRILARLGDVDAAAETYREVSSALAPVAAEMETVARDQKSLSAYFDWVVGQDASDFSAGAPVGRGTQTFIEGDPGMSRVLTMVRDLSQERDTVRESFEAVETLLMALQGGNPFDTFPDLKEKWFRLRETEARFLLAGCEVGDAAARLIATAPQDARTAHTEAMARRRELEARLRAGPVTFADHAALENRTSDRFQAVERELFLVESFLAIERQQMRAIEQWTRENPPLAQAGETEQEALRALQERIDGQDRMLQGLERDAARLRQELAAGRMTVLGTPDSVRTDEHLRRALVVALNGEMERLGELIAGHEGERETVLRSAITVAQRATRQAEDAAPLCAGLVDTARRGAQEFEADVAREKLRLQDVAANLQKIEMDTRMFAQTEGAALFRDMRERLRDVLFEADVGIVDMAWQREQEVFEKLRQLGLARAEKMKAVEESQRLLEQTRATTGASDAPTGKTP